MKGLDVITGLVSTFVELIRDYWVWFTIGFIGLTIFIIFKVFI